MQDLTPDEMYGIAKKHNRDFSEHSLHTHGALIQLLNIGFEHRKVEMQRTEKLKNDAMQEQALELQKQHMGLMQAEENRRRAEEMKVTAGPALVTQ